ncbi:MAG: hypothetical protein KJ077_32905 [Anaerolineae bacterium]|nr:hypothetical protein [Anaerolineae bacterium]
MTDFKAFLLKLTDNLNLLREREAKHGSSAPLEFINQINDHEQAISLTEQARRGELSESEWREALQPLLVAVQARTGEAASGVTLGDIGGSIQHSTIVGRDANQITINVVNLLDEAVKQPDQKLAPEVQAIVDLALAQVKAQESKTVQRYLANPADHQASLREALVDLLKEDRGLVARLDALLARYEQAAKERPAQPGTSYKATLKGSGAIAQGPGAKAVGAGGVMVGGNVGGRVVTGSQNRIINTGGGMYNEGSINTGGGDFVGRDQITGITGAELAQLFQTVYQRIETRPADPNVDKEEVKETVQKIEQEAKKGEEANPTKVERWLKTLKEMAPDIGDVTIACLTNPAAGVAMVIKKIAEKAQAEAGKAS